MWILFLVFYYAGHGVSTAQISGFVDQNDCGKAGNEIITQLGDNNSLITMHVVKFVCIHQSK